MSCAADFFLAQFDTSPSIRATLFGTDGKTAMNLTGASVRFEIRPANDSAAATVRTAVLEDALNGVVRYDWQPSDVALAGMFRAEWVVTLAGGREMTWPNDRYIRIEIKPRLDPTDTSPVVPPAVGTIAAIVSLDGVASGAQQLVNLSTTSLANGSEAWCELEHDYFVLEKTGTSFTADNVNVVAGLNGGQWLRRGFALPVTVDPSTGGGLALPVGFRVRKADGTAAWDKYGAGATAWLPIGQSAFPTLETATLVSLAAAASATLGAGQLAFVDSVKAVFVLMPSTVAARTGIRIAASGKTGYQWVRLMDRNPVWEVQTTWTIDPTNSTGLASDDNTGLDSSAPLLTYTEHSCRLASAEIAQAVTTTVLGDQQTGDNPTYTFWTRPSITHTFQGVGTVLYSSTVTGFTAMTLGLAADDAQFVDSAVPGGTFTAAGALAKGVILKRTNGTVIYAWVLKDLGSTTCRLSQPFNPLNSVSQPAFAAADTYQALRLPRVSSIRFADEMMLGVKFDLFDWRVSSFSPPVATNNVYFSIIGSWYSRAITFHQNPCFDAGAVSLVGPLMIMTCGAFKGTGVTRQSLLLPLNTEGNIVCFQGATAMPSGTGVWNAGQANFYDCTAPCVTTDTYSRAHFNLTINGKSNTGKVVRATQGTQIVWLPAALFLAGITSDATPYQAGVTVSAAPIALQADGNGCFQTSS